MILNLCVLFGGSSYEHEISIVSAITLKKLLPSIETFVFLDGNHNFYLIPKDKMQSKFFSSKEYLKEMKIYLKVGGFYHKTLLGEKKLPMPMVLNLIHGGDGENGVIASLLDFYGIAYIGPRNPACVLSFDKELTKLLAKNRGILSLDYQVLYKGAQKEIKFPFPVIIKPARLGSSIGIFIANNQKELDYGLEEAFEYDNKAIVEPFISGIKEYNLAGYKSAQGIKFSFVEEPQKKEFLDFEKKYLDFSRTQNAKEADIPEALQKTLQDNFIKIYENLFEGALIRCDFFVKDDLCYLNEINPIPGSMANYLFDDFKGALEELSKNLPKSNEIRISYELLHKIQFAKGK